MKTLTILFESPNVFYAVIDGVNIRIENYQLLPIIIGHNGFDSFKTKTQEVLKSGDIFQVEGFEYEVKKEHCAYPDTCYERHCNKFCSEKVAILKLAKEEEQEPDIQTSDIHHTFKPHGQFKVKEEEPKEHCMYKSCCQDRSCDLCSNEKEPEPLYKNAPVIKTYSDTDGMLNSYENSTNITSTCDIVNDCYDGESSDST